MTERERERESRAIEMTDGEKDRKCHSYHSIERARDVMLLCGRNFTNVSFNLVSDR